MKQKIILFLALCLTAGLLAGALSTTASAAETYGYEVVITPSPVAIGSEVTLTVRLTDYTSEKSAIRGFQIDINDVDDVLPGATCTTLVTDTDNLLSNTAKYQSGKDIVRHLYAKMSGAMDYSQTDLLRISFKIPASYTQAGTLVLPMTMLIQNEAGDKLTYKDTIEIRYAPASEIPSEPDEPDIVNVDVSWGSMEFVYTDGTWNPQTYTYEGGGWTDNGSGYVKVSNTGSVDTTAAFAYTTARTDIAGSFDVAGTADLTAGSEITAWLTLTGKPDGYLEGKVVIGAATVTIGGE